MDFSRLKDLIIPEGVVTRIAVGDTVLWERPLTAFNVTYAYTSDSTFGPDYAQGWRIWEFTPDGEEVGQDMEWTGYAVGNTIQLACEDGVADTSNYIFEWRMYDENQTSYTIIGGNDYMVSFVMPAYDVKIEAKVVYVEPKYTATKHKATVTEEYSDYIDVPLSESGLDPDGYIDDYHYSNTQTYVGTDYRLVPTEGYEVIADELREYNQLDGGYFISNEYERGTHVGTIVYQYNWLSDNGSWADYRAIPIAVARREYLGNSYSTTEEVGTIDLTLEEIQNIKNNAIHIESTSFNRKIYYVSESGGLYAYTISDDLQ
jgi:hypothetical protein